LIVSTPLGTAVGGPIVAALGAAQTLTASGVATILLAIVATIAWRRRGTYESRADVRLGGDHAGNS
jgi:hypothetical protein